MRHNLIMLEDNAGRRFHIEVWTPSFTDRGKAITKGCVKKESHWRSIDKGFIRLTGGSGWSEMRGFPTTMRQLFLGPAFGTSEQPDDGEDFRWGIILRDYEGTFGTNDSGYGEVKQSWVLGFQPGLIRWFKPDESQMIQAHMNQQRQATGR